MVIEHHPTGVIYGCGVTLHLEEEEVIVHAVICHLKYDFDKGFWMDGCGNILQFSIARCQGQREINLIDYHLGYTVLHLIGLEHLFFFGAGTVRETR